MRLLGVVISAAATVCGACAHRSVSLAPTEADPIVVAIDSIAMGAGGTCMNVRITNVSVRQIEFSAGRFREILSSALTTNPDGSYAFVIDPSVYGNLDPIGPARDDRIVIEPGATVSRQELFLGGRLSDVAAAHRLGAQEPGLDVVVFATLGCKVEGSAVEVPATIKIQDRVAVK